MSEVSDQAATTKLSDQPLSSPAASSPQQQVRRRFAFFGMRTKDFITLGISVLALVLSGWGAWTAYEQDQAKAAEEITKNEMQKRQILYVASRVGEALGETYRKLNRTPLQETDLSDARQDLAVIASELAGLGIRIQSGDLSAKPVDFRPNAENRFSRAGGGLFIPSELPAAKQIAALLDVYFGYDSSWVFSAQYSLTVLKYALEEPLDFFPIQSDGRDICTAWAHTVSAQIWRSVVKNHHLTDFDCDADTNVVEMRVHDAAFSLGFLFQDPRSPAFAPSS